MTILSREKKLCVYCRRFLANAEWRPFCSERCQQRDLSDWVNERYRIEEESASSIPEASNSLTERLPDNNR